MLTVPQAARRAGRNPETIRRWIRDGRLRARKVGTQHTIEDGDLEALLEASSERLPLPPEWQRTFWGGPMPDFVSILRRQRSEH
jgi:excisionase family DNA binding protein